jgi:hypothetical protein
MCIRLDGTTELVIPVIIVPVLDMIPPHNLDFTMTSIVLPIEEIDFLEEPFFVIFELTDHVG